MVGLVSSFPTSNRDSDRRGKSRVARFHLHWDEYSRLFLSETLIIDESLASRRERMQYAKILFARTRLFRSVLNRRSTAQPKISLASVLEAFPHLISVSLVSTRTIISRSTSSTTSLQPTFPWRQTYQARCGRSPVTGIFVDGTSSPSHR